MKYSSLGGQCLAEFIGTALIVFLGCGAVAALVLSGSQFGQWEISITWGLGVALAIYISAGVSGAHLNPAVTLALWVWKDLPTRKVIPYITAQTSGAFVAAALVYAMYAPLFEVWESSQHIARGSAASVVTAGIFTTFPHAALNNVQALLVEILISALLMLGILALTDDDNGTPRGYASPLLIGILVAVIGACFGSLTGFAMNPARDFGPRLFAFLAGWGEVALSGGRESLYLWVPLIGPIIGAQLGAATYLKLIAPQLPKSLKERPYHTEQKIQQDGSTA
ncbi:MIP/aquaporin family protein [Craterilacuibacter sp.]|uniref:MIP/aquaporin family protein n=1 Tax=Craterilacuibacter sp. TaxID=2870909 RepID=UPI003F3B260D